MLLKGGLPCPGDALAAEAAIASLKSLYPSIEVGLEGWEELFRYNPWLSPVTNPDITLQMKEPLINYCNERVYHKMQGYCDYLSRELELDIPCIFPSPKLYFSREERSQKPFPFPYIVLNAGIKSDYPIKGWHRYQEVVNAFKGKIAIVQVGKASDTHKPLEGTINMIGKTTQRDFLVLCLHSVLGIGGVSFIHHVYAALGKPFVCIASGFEPASWERYNSEAYLCKANCVPCGLNGKGCWKGRVEGRGSLCELPLVVDGIKVPTCMELVSAAEVIKAVEDFLT